MSLLTHTALRHTVTASLALALVTLAGCKGDGAKSTKLIPEAATIVGGADLAGLQKSKLWEDHLSPMVKDKGGDVMKKMEECDLGLDKWKSVVVGATPEGGNDKMAIVVVADGLGKKETLECAHGKLKEVEGKDPWTTEDDGKTLKLDKDGVAYVVDDNTIVMAGPAWAEDVKKLVGGEGKSAFDGDLKDVLGRTDMGKNIWWAAKVPGEFGGMAKDKVGAEVKDVAGFVDFSSGMELAAWVGVGDDKEAESAKEKLEGLLALGKDMAKKQGVSDESLDSVKFDADGAVVVVKAKATEEDIAKGMEQAKGFM